MALAEIELCEDMIAFEEARSALVSGGEDADENADRTELDAALQGAATRVERAEAGLLSARSRLYNSWRAYIGSVGRSLQVVEGAWEAVAEARRDGPYPATHRQALGTHP